MRSSQRYSEEILTKTATHTEYSNREHKIKYTHDIVINKLFFTEISLY